MTVTVRPYKRGGKNTRRWEVDIMLTLPGRPKIRERKVAPVGSKSAAKAWGEDRQRQLIEHAAATDPADDDRPDVAKKEVPTLAKFIPRFVEGYCIANKHRPSTMEKRKGQHRLYLIPILGPRRLDRISAEDIQLVKSKMAHLSPRTVNNVLKELKVILRVAGDWGVIKQRPVKVTLLKEDEPELAFYSFAEYLNLITAAGLMGPEVFALVVLGGDAGLRRGEMIALEWKDIDLAAGRLTIARSEYNGVVTSTKSKRNRTVPLSMSLTEALQALPIRGARVLYEPCGRTLRPSVLQRWLTQAQAHAGLPPKGPHTLRHTFCSHLAMRGAPARAIQKLAGHVNLKTTEGYMQLSPATLDSSIALLDQRPKWRDNGDGDQSSLTIQ